MVPPRPANRRFQRSTSPNPDRFAPSPLNESPLKSSKQQQAGARNDQGGEPVARATSVELPSLGEEGKEYDGLAQELAAASKPEESASPEQTRTVADDLKLHAPKPSLPAASAKQRVMTVTRTDSERAAAFGIGRPSSVEDATPAQPSDRSLREKASTASQFSTPETHIDDEHGIPEIGQQVPMCPSAGDVQAPSPAPAAAEGPGAKQHVRRTSAHGNLPPGSYGLHGHGVPPQDKLEKAYYEKHPELLKKEHVPHHYDRPNDFSMSSDDLNRIVRDTASRGSGLGVKDYAGTPSDQVGWQALEESASRVASPGVFSPEGRPSPKPASSGADSESGSRRKSEIEEVIHVDEPTHRRSAVLGDSESAKAGEEGERSYTAPILADDEVAKDPSPHALQPAVEPPAFEVGKPSSRPTSRPGSLHKEASSLDLRPTPPEEDVVEYEPLFDDDGKPEATKPANEEKTKNHTRRFPSADVWEDAPSSVLYTAEVSTPEVIDEQEKRSPAAVPPPRESETPAQAFARHQEELAEKEAREHGPDGSIPARHAQKPVWAQHQMHLVSETPAPRPMAHRRFPSRDVWEDTPDSLKLETTVSTPQMDEEPSPLPADNAKPPEIPERPKTKSPDEPAPAPAPAPAEKPAEKPAIPERPKARSPEAEKPAERPAIPERPKPRQPSGDDKPAIPGRPKPQIPARPAKTGPASGSGGQEPAETAAPAPPRPKPAVPARPVGSRIAALQAGFMNDLNRRLQLGPQAVLPKKKKEEDDPAVGGGDERSEQKEEKKVPLSDARKGRARGPQRRAPTSVAAAVSAAASASSPSDGPKAEAKKPEFGFSVARTVFVIDPEDGTLSAGGEAVEKKKEEEETGKDKEVEKVKIEEKKEEEEDKKVGEQKVEEKRQEEKVDEKEQEKVEEEEKKVEVGVEKGGKSDGAEEKEPNGIAGVAKSEEGKETREGERDEKDTVQEGERKEDKDAPEEEKNEKTEEEPAEAKTDHREPEREAQEEPKADPGAETEAKAESEAPPEKEETTTSKSLATNPAGETLVEEQVRKDEEHDEVQPVKVVEN